MEFCDCQTVQIFCHVLAKKGSKLAKITVNIFDLTRNTKIHQVEIRKKVEKISHNIFQSKNRHFDIKNELSFFSIFGGCILNRDPPTKTGRSRTDLLNFSDTFWRISLRKYRSVDLWSWNFWYFPILNLKRNFYHLFDDWNGQRKMEIMVSWMLWQKKTHQNVLLSGTNHRPPNPAYPLRQSRIRQIMIRYKTQLGRSDSSGRTKSLASCIHVPYLCYLYQARLLFWIVKSQLAILNGNSKLRYENYATDKRAIRIGH